MDSVPSGSFDTLKTALAAMRELAHSVRYCSAIIEVVDSAGEVLGRTEVVYKRRKVPVFERAIASVLVAVAPLTLFSLTA
jgi:hypothetical protein